MAPYDAKKKGNLVLWHDHVLMLTGNTFLWCLRCGRWADKLTRHLRTETCKGEPTPKTEKRYKSLCQGRHPKPPHQEVGLVRPLQLDAWPQWCRRADAEQAIQVAAKVLAPLVPELGLEVVEVVDDDGIEPLAVAPLLPDLAWEMVESSEDEVEVIK